jgi:hypothetical protein
MKNKCKEFHLLLEKLIAGEINAEEHSNLKSHTDSCKDCMELYTTNIVLSKTNHPIEQAEELDFDIMRKRVIESIEKGPKCSFTSKFQKFLDSVVLFINKPEYAVAAITLIVGFFLGRALPPDENGVTGGILKQISSIAEQNTYFSDTQKSPYRFTNVSMKQIDNDKIEMSFDVSTTLEIVREKNDPLVKEVITQTMMEPENVGSNLKAISYSESLTDKKIKQALIYSMHNAPITAVRLKSMESLMNYKMDPEIQEAFIKVLLEENTIQMNLMAIDYLTQNNYNADSLKSIIDEIDPKKSTAIFVRAKKNQKNNQ